MDATMRFSDALRTARSKTGLARGNQSVRRLRPTGLAGSQARIGERKSPGRRAAILRKFVAHHYRSVAGPAFDHSLHRPVQQASAWTAGGTASADGTGSEAGLADLLREHGRRHKRGRHPEGEHPGSHRPLMGMSETRARRTARLISSSLNARRPARSLLATATSSGLSPL